MNTPKISVIVPIYNAEKYLNECIDSILNQDFTDFELLLVDDGSNDNSGQLCDEYAKKDKHIKVFHKNNGGVSSARNLGIDNAKGEYIIFIDSDDYVDVNYLSILMSGGESDLVITGYDSFGYKVENFSFENAEYFGQKISICLSRYLNSIPFRVPWDKRYKSEIIRKYSIRFDPSLKIAEDTVFVQTYLLYCDTLELKKGIPYHYRMDFSTLSSSKYSLSSREYIYTSQIVMHAYKMISLKYSLCLKSYYNVINKIIIILYYRHIVENKFTLKGFSGYRYAMNSICPNIVLSTKLYNIYNISYYLARKKMYFFSFFILRFVYPLKSLLYSIF